MDEGVRGSVEKITLDVVYPDGTRKQRIIEGAELDRLAMIALGRDAIERHTPESALRDEALHSYDTGEETPGEGLPAMMLMYTDGAYTMECKPSDHHPPWNG